MCNWFWDPGSYVLSFEIFNKSISTTGGVFFSSLFSQQYVSHVFVLLVYVLLQNAFREGSEWREKPSHFLRKSENQKMKARFFFWWTRLILIFHISLRAFFFIESWSRSRRRSWNLTRTGSSFALPKLEAKKCQRFFVIG